MSRCGTRNLVRFKNHQIVPMSAEDISISHTIKSNGAGTILVKFQSHKAKSRLYKARTKLKNLRLTDIFPHVSTATRVAAGTELAFAWEDDKKKELYWLYHWQWHSQELATELFRARKGRAVWCYCCQKAAFIFLKAFGKFCLFVRTIDGSDRELSNLL